MSKKKTHDEYVKEVEKIRPDIEVIDTYINAKTKILHKCLIHNVEWKVLPSDILNRRGCPKCKSDKIHNSLFKGHERYVKEVERINPNVVVLEKYIGSTIPILHKCLKHNIKWKITPSSVLNGAGCEKCHAEKIANALQKKHFQYVDELSIANPVIEVIGTYINSSTPVKHRCLIHDITWEITPISALRGSGCPMCLKEKISNCKLKTHEQYVDELKTRNSSVIAIEKYIGANKPMLHKCMVCGKEWNAFPNNVLKGFGCPDCNTSKGEKAVRLWLEKNHIKFEQQKRFPDCCDKRPLPFDFYLPDYNSVIEYNGLQHYEAKDYFGGETALIYTQKHDRIKEEYCIKNNIGFLCVPYNKNIDTELNNFLFI